MTRGHATLTGLLTRFCRKAELPVFFTQCKGHEQRRLGCVLLPIVCRWRCHELSPPYSMSGDGKKLTNNGPSKESVDKHSISQVTGPSSSYVPWSHTPPDMAHSSPTPRRSQCCLQVNQDPGHPGRL